MRFRERRKKAGLGSLPEPTWDEVNRLAKDFVDVAARAKLIAAEQIQAADNKFNKLTTIIAAAFGIAGIIGTVLIGWLTGVQSVKNDVNDLKSKIDVVELKKDIGNLATRIDDLEKTNRGSQKK